MVWHGDSPALKNAILDPAGVVSVYGKVRIPTGRKKRRMKGYSGFGDLDPPNSRLARLLLGELPVEELDDEELGFGVPRCDDRKFSVKAAYDASQVPAGLQQAMRRELFRRANLRIGGNVMSAIDRIVQIATRPDSEDKDAMKAAEWLINRAMGKTPDVVVHTQDKPYEVVIDNIARRSRAESRAARGEVIEGSVVAELEEGQWKPTAGKEVADGITRERRS